MKLRRAIQFFRNKNGGARNDAQYARPIPTGETLGLRANRGSQEVRFYRQRAELGDLLLGGPHEAE